MTDPVWPSPDADELPLHDDSPQPLQWPPPPITPVSAVVTVRDKPQVVFVLGSGGSGKTLLVRYLTWRMQEHGRALPALAALDPGPRSLGLWFEGVQQPPSRDTVAVGRWLAQFLEGITEAKIPALLDFGGGGEIALAQLAHLGGWVETLEEAGVAVIAAYMLTPRLMDLTILPSMAEAGFRPKRTALFLNTGKTDPTVRPEQAFAPVLRHSLFRGAFAAGGVPVWLPALDSLTMAIIEQRRYGFTHARDRGVGGLFGRSAVGRFLDRFEQALEPLAAAGWLP